MIRITLKNKMIVNKKIFIFFIYSLIPLLSQEIPSYLINSKIKKFRYDVGKDWINNSTLNSLKFDNRELSVLAYESYFSIKKDISHSLNSYNRINLPNYLYAYATFAMRKNNSNVTDSHGSTYSFTSDYSGIGFSNNWLSVQFGKGTQNWGANYGIELSLYEDSESYNYGLLGLDFDKLRVKYLHAYLETDSLNFNRFLTARGIELTDKKSIVFGISEIVIYSGLNRPFDFSYFNPMSSHLEIELNDRANMIGTGNGNGIWQLSFDFFSDYKIRFSLNYLIDEFVLDKKQILEGKSDGSGYSFKIAYNNFLNEKDKFILFFSRSSIGTHTFRHQLGSNNFVVGGKPIGSNLGSDCYQNKFGFVLNKQNNLFLSSDIEQNVSGENNIIDNPYDPYTNYLIGTFPSGNKTPSLYINNEIEYYLNKRYTFSISIKYKMNQHSNHKKITEIFSFSITSGYFFRSNNIH